MKLCALFLTCANSEEADKITKSLLEKHLVVCIKKFPVQSSFLWQGRIDSANEVLLIMDSIEENFERVKTEVKKLHSYDTFVFFSVPIIQTTSEVEKWIKEELE